ncbi:MAG: hypothetical protein ACI9VM_000400 [Candidatus Azotimanducaceae bacterium]|jgi:hypothetical protein
MEFILLLIFGYVIYLGIKVGGLENEIKELKSSRPHESEATQLVHADSTASVTAPSAASQTDSSDPARQMYVGPSPVPSATQPSGQTTPHAEEGFSFIEWLKEDFFVKLGALLLLIAFGWFVNYAFANDWIGPAGRIALGLLLGIAIMGLGVWRIQKYRHQGSIFVVLGSTAVLLTVFAARSEYDMFTPATALGLMFLSILFVAFMSVRYQSDRLALAGLVLAGIAPFMTNAPDTNVVLLFSYLMVVVLGTLWVVRLTGSHTLTFASVLLAFFYSLPFFDSGVGVEDKIVALLFAFAFTGVFFVANVTSLVHDKDEKAKQGHTFTAFFSGIYLVCWIALAAPAEWQSLLYVAWMLVFSSGAFIVYMHCAHRTPFYIYGAVSTGLLAAATAAELDGALLTIAYTVEAAALVYAASALRDPLLAGRMSLLLIAPVVMSFEHVASRAWRDGFLHEDFFALLILSFVLFITGLVLYATKEESTKDSPISAGLILAGSLYALLLVWLVTHSVMGDDSATMISLVIYTILGITLFVRGRVYDHKTRRVLGGLLLGFVTLRLLFVDVWQMELIGRVITFAAIGVLLMSTAFIGKNKKQDTPVQE